MHGVLAGLAGSNTMSPFGHQIGFKSTLVKAQMFHLLASLVNDFRILALSFL